MEGNGKGLGSNFDGHKKELLVNGEGNRKPLGAGTGKIIGSNTREGTLNRTNFFPALRSLKSYIYGSSSWFSEIYF